MSIDIEKLKKKILNPFKCTYVESKNDLLDCIEVIEQQQAEIERLKNYITKYRIIATGGRGINLNHKQKKELIKKLEEFEDADWLKDSASSETSRSEAVDDMTEEELKDWVFDSMLIFNEMLK